jgi:cytochrome c peroxidase
MPLLGGVGRASGLGAITALLLLDQGASLLAAAGGGATTIASRTTRASDGTTVVAPRTARTGDGPTVAVAGDTRPADSNTAYDWHLPRGFPSPAVPADNAMSAAKVALGRRLFFEPRLSITGQHSCGSCHEPGQAYTDGRARAVGATGQPLPHSAMSLVKPEVQSLEAQMLEPLLNEHPVELGLAGRQASVCALLAADPEYRAAFAQAFAQESATAVSFPNVIKAIAAFERTLIFGNSPFDRYVFGGDHDVISAEAKRGMQLFYSPRAGCGACHSGFNFNGNWRDSQGNTGKPAFANNGVGDQAMRVPTLRNIALTAPYMHDGRFPTLDAVLDHYSRVASLPGNDAKLRPFNLSTDERADLIAFLQTLTDAEFSGR